MEPETQNFTGTADQRQEVVRLAWAAEAAGRVWTITPESLEDLLRMSYQPWVLDPEAVGRKPGRPPKIQGDIAIVALKGVLMGDSMSLLEALFGIEGGLRSFSRGLRQAASDPDVGAIVLDIDSPGGLVDKMPETAAMVREAASKKQVVAVANTLAASGAYWLGSQASEFVVTPSGEAGGIGVYATHADRSAAFEKAGINHTLVSAGKYKTEGNPYGPLDGEGVKALQESVDDFYNLFVKDVASGRQASVSDVKNGFGEGRALTAKRAVEAGLADRVDTLDNVVAGLVRRTGQQVAATEAETQYTSEERGRLVHTLANLGPLPTPEEEVPA
jgi:signal peptide peptidase SppA